MKLFVQLKQGLNVSEVSKGFVKLTTCRNNEQDVSNLLNHPVYIFIDYNYVYSTYNIMINCTFL